ncbi:hypothetical protein STENM223S_08817 [Streptomyces tendae]
MVTSPETVFIIDQPGWSVRHTRPGPTSTASIAYTSTGRPAGRSASLAATRSSTDTPRGPVPTTAIRYGSGGTPPGRSGAGSAHVVSGAASSASRSCRSAV